MKVMTVVGARPQFIKEAVVSRELRKHHTEVLVHTGQHYDYNMSELFFEELGIPNPDYNLGISGGSHAEMTGRMMIELERVMKFEAPDWVCIYGDTNSTLAAALVAAKLHIRICHVEAGIRTHFITNPEEINRICTDHISSLLLAVTERSMDEMLREGLDDRSVYVGDPMYDAFVLYSENRKIEEVILNNLNGCKTEVPKEYYYLTCHREENTVEEKLTQILDAMEQLDCKVIYPVHPRNRTRVVDICNTRGYNNIVLTEPVGYLESICLVNNSKKIVTDSGGLQREAFYACKQCVTILDFVCWPETMTGNRNQLSKADSGEILTHLSSEQYVDNTYMPFGNGKAASNIVSAIENYK